MCHRQPFQQSVRYNMTVLDSIAKSRTRTHHLKGNPSLHDAERMFGEPRTNGRCASIATCPVTYSVTATVALLMSPIDDSRHQKTAMQMLPVLHAALMIADHVGSRQIRTVAAAHHPLTRVDPDPFRRLSRGLTIFRQTRRCSLCRHRRSGCPVDQRRKPSFCRTSYSRNQHFWKAVLCSDRHRGNKVVLVGYDAPSSA